MDLNKVEKILVRGPNWIGDAVMCTPALAVLRERFPEAKITLLVNATIAELLRENPHLDRIWVYDKVQGHRGLMGKLKLCRKIEGESFDLAVLFQNAFEAAFLARIARIPIRYGYPTDGRGFLLTVRAPLPKGSYHQADYYLHLLKSLGGKEGLKRPSLRTTALEDENARRLLKKHGVEDGERVVGINPGATYGAAKRWPAERYARLADRLIEFQEARIVIFGGPGEEVLGREISAQMRHPAIALSGCLSVRELMAMIRQCALFITNDSGPMHIAAAFEIPVVAIFGPTDPEMTSPLGNRNLLLRKQVECSPCLLRECPIDHRCMTRISVEEVFEAAESQLKAQSASGGSRLKGDEEPQLEVQSASGGSKLKGKQKDFPLSFQLSALSKVAVFLDRDGTINEDVGYLDSPDRLKLLPGAAEAIRQINQSQLKAVILTNQSGVARGYYPEEKLKEIHEHLETILSDQGARLDGIYYCIHHPDEGCQCRKPSVGMLEVASRELSIDLSRSYVVGDKATDIQLAHNAGAKGILVLTGHGINDLPRLDPSLPNFVARDLSEAVQWIMEDVRKVNVV